MTNLDIIVKLTGQLSEAELRDFYLLVRDKYVYRIPFPGLGQRPGATPGRFAYATQPQPPAATSPHAT
jgi:hypothetical protein